MKVTNWEVSPMNEMFGSTRAEIARERGEVLTPPCKNENHNLFWEQFSVGPTDSYSTVAEYGITEERQCLRCQRIQKRRWTPECREDAATLIEMCEEYEKRTRQSFKDSMMESVDRVFGPAN